MKKLLALTLLVASPAFAGLKFQLRPQYHWIEQKVGVTSGLSLYQGITKTVALNAWTGMGVRPVVGSKNIWWYVANADLDLQWTKRVTLSPGAQFRWSPTFSDRDNSVSVKMTYKLW